MTDIGTVVFLTLMGIQALPSLYSHIYLHHVIWNKTTPKAWGTAMRESNSDEAVQKLFFALLSSIAVFTCTLIAYATAKVNPVTFPTLAATIFVLICAGKYYLGTAKKTLVVCITFFAVLSIMIVKSDYKGTLIFVYINEFGIIAAYIELFITSVMMNKTYIKTFKSVAQCP